MSSFKFDSSLLKSGLLEYETKAQAAVHMYAENSARKLENDAKANAPWTDRTGHARQRLTGDVLIVKNGYKLRLAHGVDYGVHLENRNEGKYAIIDKTIRFTGTFEIMPGFQHLLERLK